MCCESSDGLYMAEQNLRLRVGGAILGTKQSRQTFYQTFVCDPDNSAMLVTSLQHASALATLWSMGWSSGTARPSKLLQRRSTRT
jgi:RecG-like helicase